MPVRPTGASATGIATFSPIISDAVLRLSMLRATRWRSLYLAKAAVLSMKVLVV